MKSRLARGRGVVFAGVGALLVLASSGCARPARLAVPQDVLEGGAIYSLSFDPTAPPARAPTVVGRARLDRLRSGGPGPLWKAAPPHPVVDPELEAILPDTLLHPGRRVRVLVTFRDTVAVAALPAVDPLLGLDQPANLAVVADGQTIVSGLVAARDSLHDSDSATVALCGGVVLERFWLAQEQWVELPLRNVPRLSLEADVRYIELDAMGPPPSADSDPANDPVVAAARTGIVRYGAPLTASGHVALLDTGVRADHPMLGITDPSRLRDFVNGGADGRTGTALDPGDGDPAGHGTSSAAILVGNPAAGPRHAGMTSADLVSCRVYDDVPPAVDPSVTVFVALKSATIRAMQWAQLKGYRTMVLEVQKSWDAPAGLAVPDDVGLALATDHAFRQGARIVASNGNNGVGDVGPVAVAHGAIGVGAFGIMTGATDPGQSHGDLGDGRHKPDLQFPTDTETAANGNGMALHVYGQTSGATPYAGAAAVVLERILHAAAIQPMPGLVYAGLILCGTATPPFDVRKGAGPLRLPPPGPAFCGRVRLAGGQQCTMSIPIPGWVPRRSLVVAAWWPEGAAARLPAGETHTAVELLVNGGFFGGNASSTDSRSVFQRAAAPLGWGMARITLRAPYAAQPPRDVYWAAYIRSPGRQ